MVVVFLLFFFFKQKTAYEMRISDWSSDVCSSDLFARLSAKRKRGRRPADFRCHIGDDRRQFVAGRALSPGRPRRHRPNACRKTGPDDRPSVDQRWADGGLFPARRAGDRSEEHTSELQSLMRISYAVFCLKKQNNKALINNQTYT